jgi:hypothetical protein
MKNRITLFVGLALLVTSAAIAGGAMSVNGLGEPMAWGTASPITYNPDQGGLGTLTNTEARDLLRAAFDEWESVGVLTFTEGALLSQDVNAVDIPYSNPAHWQHFWRVDGDGLAPVIFDTDGSVMDSLYGNGASFHILGVAALDSPVSTNTEITGASIVINGAMFDGIGLPDSPEDLISDLALQGVMVHEIGHFLNLDHSVLNHNMANDGFIGNDIYLPTMYPVATDDEEVFASLNPDDIVALRNIYDATAPTDGFTGQVLTADGSRFQGAGVVLRSSTDPAYTAYSTISGARFFPCNPGSTCDPCNTACDPGNAVEKGSWEIQFIENGHYTICVEQIDTRFSIANSNFVGPLATPPILPGPEDCLDGALWEDPGTADDPDVADYWISDAASDVGIYLNALPTTDGNEPNNTLALATAAGTAASSTTLGALITSGDADWYQIDGHAGSILHIDVDAAEMGSTLDPIIGIYDHTGTLVSIVDDAIDPDSGEFSLDPATRVSVGSDGPFYVAVSSAPDDDLDGLGGVTTGAYWIRFQLDIDADGLPYLDDACTYDPLNDPDGDGICTETDPDPGVVNVVQVTLNDNGDDDGFADTRETVQMQITVTNRHRRDLTGVTAQLTTDSEKILCIPGSIIDIGTLDGGETKTATARFTFVVADVDRVGTYEDFSSTFAVQFQSDQFGSITGSDSITLDLDLDGSGGGAATTWLESFEGGMGQFAIQNLDAGLASLVASDGYRCQYLDPDNPNSNSYGQIADCYLGASAVHADMTWWSVDSPSNPVDGGRAYSGTNSLNYGVQLPGDYTTPLAALEAVATSDPIYLGLEGDPPILTLKHQVSLIDWRSVNLTGNYCTDRAIVALQLADGAGNPVGDWVKLHAIKNSYGTQVQDYYVNCLFDPVDDGNTEDDFFDPDDPAPRYGPSSTCSPGFGWAWQGSTVDAYSSKNVGRASDGPGLEGAVGPGTWVESKFNLERFRGRSVRIRFLATAIKAGSAETAESLFNWNPTAGDDGWWIDDVTVTNALTSPASLTVDTKDNSGLIGLDDGDSDGVPDACDVCATTPDGGQADSDSDGVGDACDLCVSDPDPGQTDADSDGVGDACDNCPAVANGTQNDADSDGYGAACDCGDHDSGRYPGATEHCNGADDDCDGIVDEGCSMTCSTVGAAGTDRIVCDLSTDSSQPSLAWNGHGYGVAWSDARSGTPGIYFGRIDVAGSPVGLQLRLSGTDATSGNPSLVWTGNEYALIWSDTRDGNAEIYFARLDAGGTAVGSQARITHDGATSTAPSLVWNGTGFGVAWTDERSGPDIYFARLDDTGSVLGAETRISSNDAGYGDQSDPDLAWNGTEYGLAWQGDLLSNVDVYFARIDAAGVSGGGSAITSDPAGSHRPSLSWSGSEWGVAWSDDRDGDEEIYFARLDASGAKLGGDLRLTDSTGASDHAALVRAGGEYGLAWTDARNGAEETWFVRLNDSGGVVGSAFQVSDGTALAERPSAIWNGAGYAVSWSAAGGIADWDIAFKKIGCCEDLDSDGYDACGGDCDDGDPAVNPGAMESCNGIDDDCDGDVDGGLGGDADSDGYVDCGDNCPNAFNPAQADRDGDTVGDPCDNCADVPNADQADADSDGTGDACSPDLTPPTVTMVLPVDGAVDVALATEVVLVMSEAVDPQTATAQSVYIAAGGIKAPGSVRVSADGRVITFDPSGILDVDADYVVTVNGGLRDVSGNPAASFSSTFDTTANVASGTLPVEEIGGEGGGTTLGGENANDNLGFANAAVGDVNGDGLADLLIGAPNVDVDELQDAGRATLIFGAPGLQSSAVTIDSLAYNGDAAEGFVGRTVSKAGDMGPETAGDGDGIDDMLIGAPWSDTTGTDAGAVYLVFGDAGLDELAPGSRDLGQVATNLDGEGNCLDATACGVLFLGEAAGDLAGTSVTYAGDINHDGRDDVAIGAPGASPGGKTDAGKVYLVYGPLNPGVVDLGSVGSTTPGLVFEGENAGDQAGLSVSSWQDQSGDGIDDLLIGAPGATALDAMGSPMADAGYVYAIHGGTSNLDTTASPGVIALSRLASGLGDEVQGTVFIGAEPGGEIGRSITGAFDRDGDGTPDVMIGTNFEAWLIPGDGPKTRSGAATLQGTPRLPTALSRPVSGDNVVDEFGAVAYVPGDDGDIGPLTVGSAGDVNNDGFDDVIVGASEADPEGLVDAGTVYIIYGSPVPPVDEEVLLSDVGTTVPGLTVDGAAAGDGLGSSVGGGADLNADGVDDALVGAPQADPTPGTQDAGESYVISPISPDEVVSLTVEYDGVNTTLEWTVTDLAVSYNVYRGTLSAIRSAGEIHSSALVQLACGIDSDGDSNGLPDTLDTDPAPTDDAFIYLVTATNLTGEGPIGPADNDPLRIHDGQCP